MTDEEKAKILEIKTKADELLLAFGEAKSRELSLAITNLEQSVMWAVKSVTA